MSKEEENKILEAIIQAEANLSFEGMEISDELKEKIKKKYKDKETKGKCKKNERQLG